MVKTSGYCISVTNKDGKVKGWINNAYFKVEPFPIALKEERAKTIFINAKSFYHRDTNIISLGKININVDFDKKNDEFTDSVDKGMLLFKRIKKVRDFASLNIQICMDVADQVSCDHLWLCRKNGNLNKLNMAQLHNPVIIHDYMVITELDYVMIKMINPKVKFYKL